MHFSGVHLRWTLWFCWNQSVPNPPRQKGERGGTRPAQAPKACRSLFFNLSKNVFGARVLNSYQTELNYRGPLIAIYAFHVDNLTAESAQHLLHYRILFRLGTQLLLFAALSLFF